MTAPHATALYAATSAGVIFLSVRSCWVTGSIPNRLPTKFGSCLAILRPSARSSAAITAAFSMIMSSAGETFVNTMSWCLWSRITNGDVIPHPMRSSDNNIDDMGPRVRGQ